jgi:hypothetical protein
MNFHLQTHNPNRPPRQLPLSNPFLPPSIADHPIPSARLLHILQLNRHHKAAPTLQTHLQTSLSQTTTLLDLFTNPTTPPSTWQHTLHPQWREEQHLHPSLTHQAYTTAHTFLTTTLPSPLPPHIPTILLTANLHQAACFLYLHSRHQRLTQAWAELAQFTRGVRHKRWLQQAKQRARDRIREQDARWSGTRTLWRGWVKSRARVLGLKRGREFDAARWGERLRVRTVGGWVVGEGVVQAGGLGEWPEERWFRVYKERRFSRVGAVTKGLRVASTFGAEPTIWGRSKLRNVEVVGDEGGKGEVLGKRRRDEAEEGRGGGGGQYAQEEAQDVGDLWLR